MNTCICITTGISKSFIGGLYSIQLCSFVTVLWEWSNGDYEAIKAIDKNSKPTRYCPVNGETTQCVLLIFIVGFSISLLIVFSVVDWLLWCFCRGWSEMEQSSCTEDRIHHALERCLYGLGHHSPNKELWNGKSPLANLQLTYLTLTYRSVCLLLTVILLIS